MRAWSSDASVSLLKTYAAGSSFRHPLTQGASDKCAYSESTIAAIYYGLSFRPSPSCVAPRACFLEENARLSVMDATPYGYRWRTVFGVRASRSHSRTGLEPHLPRLLYALGLLEENGVLVMVAHAATLRCWSPYIGWARRSCERMNVPLGPLTRIIDLAAGNAR